MPKLKGCFAQYKIWNEVMLWLKNMIGYNTIPLLISQMNDAEENLNCSIWCPWFDSHFLQITACMKWERAPTKREAKGSGKRGHIVADTLLLVMFLGRANARDTKWMLCFHAAQTGNICCGRTKCFWTESETCFVSRTQNLCPNKCCARGQTGKHLCRQVCKCKNLCPNKCCARGQTGKHLCPRVPGP